MCEPVVRVSVQGPPERDVGEGAVAGLDRGQGEQGGRGGDKVRVGAAGQVAPQLQLPAVGGGAAGFAASEPRPDLAGIARIVIGRNGIAL